MSDTADIKHALNILSLTAGQLKPHTVGYLKGYEPDRADIRDFQHDLVILAGAVDRVFEQYGEHLESLGIISAVDRRIYFTRVVMNEIESNALFAIEDGIETRIEDRREAVSA